MDLKEQYDKLLCYCYMRTKDRCIAEDIVQETFLRFWQSHSYKDTGKELAYLYTIARNLCIDEFRKPHTESIEDYSDLLSMESHDPEQNVEKLAVRLAMEELSEELREIVSLRYISELSASEIGKIMHMSRFAVHRRLKEGLRVLKGLLEEGEPGT